MTDEAPRGCDTCVGRRAVLRGAAVAAGAAVVGASAGEAGAAGRPWVTVCRLRAVPLGSGTFVQVTGGFWVVVTRPARGQVRAFDGRCPHQGGQLEDFPRRLIECTTHGSQFRLRTGALVRGPATTGLTRLEVRVRDGMVQVR